MGKRRRRTDADRPWMGPLPATRGCECQICRPEPWYDAQERATIDGVLEHGWQVLMVSDSVECECCARHDEQDEHGPTPGAGYDDHEPAPPFAYTVGMAHRADHPELLMTGLDLGLMHRALNGLAGRVLAGRRLAAGDVLENVIGRVPVLLEQVSEVGLQEAVTWSGWFHRRRPEALMVVWPSTSGVFAWQPGAPAVLDELQPPAWREPIVHTGAVAADPPWPLPVPPDARAFSCTHVVDEGRPVLYAARQSNDGGEDWTFHCGEIHPTDEARLTHIAHLVRAAPSLGELRDLRLEEEAAREDVDSPWVTHPIGC